MIKSKGKFKELPGRRFRLRSHVWAIAPQRLWVGVYVRAWNRYCRGLDICILPAVTLEVEWFLDVPEWEDDATYESSHPNSI